MRRNYPTITLCALSVVAIVLLVFAVTGCSGMQYDTLKAKASDSGSPPQCVVVTDETSGFNPTSRIIGTYCRTPTNSTQVPR